MIFSNSGLRRSNKSLQQSWNLLVDQNKIISESEVDQIKISLFKWDIILKVKDNLGQLRVLIEVVSHLRVTTYRIAREPFVVCGVVPREGDKELKRGAVLRVPAVPKDVLDNELR